MNTQSNAPLFQNNGQISINNNNDIYQNMLLLSNLINLNIALLNMNIMGNNFNMDNNNN